MAGEKSSSGNNENENLDGEDSGEDNEDEDDEYNGDSDPGTSWFSEHNAPQKVLEFLTREEFPLAPCNTLGSRRGGGGKKGAKKTALSAEDKKKQPSVLDLGTGNGSMLALLRKRGGFVGDMVGVDYSGKSVELARELQVTRRHEAYQTDSEDEGGFGSDDDAGEGEGGEEWDEIQFEEWDILGSEDELRAGKVGWFPYDKGGFDIVLDKGTFDAVSLMAEKSQCERYPGISGALVRKGGFLVVTSCNWTEEEVVRWFTSASGGSESAKLVVWGRVQYPRFRFGGQEGQGVCTVCFQRV